MARKLAPAWPVTASGGGRECSYVDAGDGVVALPLAAALRSGVSVSGAGATTAVPSWRQTALSAPSMASSAFLMFMLMPLPAWLVVWIYLMS